MWSDHRRLEERSITLHREVAKRLRARPELISMVRENLDRWIDENGEIPVLMEWQKILDSPVDNIIDVMVSPDEKGRHLRQSSPFCGILTSRERWKIYESFEAGTYYQGRGEHR
ncbi:MAG TPA: hypothetical protein HPP58_01390 [Deltaproteobacteria bacterium]|nr:hypothetical protein [Deltaproteobacteria bacterium]HIJ35975.1 hypothetical protein [Deltaproteobacteria bacterium]HIJ39594.1 hypothetical protein [Deltaproteobacteria bacterium]